MDDETSIADDLRSSIQELQNGGEEATGGQGAAGAAGREPEGKFPGDDQVPATREPGKKAEKEDKGAQKGALEGQSDGAAGQQPTGQASEQGSEEQSAEGAASEAGGEQQPASEQKAPASWSPEEREGWEKIDPKHQRAIMRRETQITQVLGQTAAQRQIVGELQRIIAPYQSILAAEKAHPLQAISELFRTSAELRTAPAPRRADLVAEMIVRFGVDIDLLDQRLNERLQNPGRPAPQMGQGQVVLDEAAIDARIRSTMEQSRTAAELEAEWNAFASAKENEFAEDLRLDIADILDMAARRGVKMSLQDAYKRATMLHPTISRIIQDRQAQTSAAQQTAAARRAKEASASVAGSGAPSQGPEEEDDSVRGAIRQAIRKHSR